MRVRQNIKALRTPWPCIYGPAPRLYQTLPPTEKSGVVMSKGAEYEVVAIYGDTVILKTELGTERLFSFRGKFDKAFTVIGK